MPDLACLRCGSTNFLPEAKVATTYAGGNVSVDIPTNPAALMFKGTRIKQLHARICGSCGHAELFIEGARELWTMYQQNNND
jgi:hypothetical protein